MPQSTKDFDVIPPAPEKAGERPAAAGAPPEDAAGRPQPVALEVPVSVNGARTVEGSDKREPFSEATQTVLVFANGAVIRLASSVTAGQLLFLTNDKTKKEVVCQVVKSKNYRNVSGYVELEFTENVAGFWGMRFPGERTAAQPGSAATKTPTPAVSSVPRPAESKPTAVLPGTNKPVEPSVLQGKVSSSAPVKKDTPIAPAARTTEVPQAKTLTPTPTAPKTESNVPASANLPRGAETRSSTALPKTGALADALGLGTTSLPPRTPEVKPTPPVVNQTKPVTPISPNPTEALKLESARLQDELSALLFAGPNAKSTPSVSAPPAANKTIPDLAAKVLEISKASSKTGVPAKINPVKTDSALDAEEVKIPSWLEPLARNAATHATNDVVKDEIAEINTAEEYEVQGVSVPLVNEEAAAPVAEEAVLHDDLLPETPVEAVRVSRGGSKGMLVGAIAAGILVLAAGGAWYVRQPSAATQGSATTANAAVTPAETNAAVVPSTSRPQAQSSPGVQARSAGSSVPAPAPGAPPVTQLQASAPAAEITAQPLKSTTKENSADLLAYKKLAEPKPQPAEQLKKPSLGEVHLAAPTVNRGGASQAPGEAESAPTLSGSQMSPAGDALGGGLVVEDAKQPTAPPAPRPVGGDVKPAHLISSVPPLYPTLAKNQHVEGDVRVDALIEANGRVSAMKVISGPTLLHQAAMDALRQWKYQPATLDGNAVPMHLTVTIQFRMQ
jgi:TonB family protein